MARWEADEEFLQKIMRVVKKKKKGGAANSSASSQSSCEPLEQLLKSQRGHHAFEETVSTALMDFTGRGRHQEVQVLLKFKADPDYREGENSFTPLHVAVNRGDAKMVEILMNGGATSSEISHGETPLRQACRHGHDDCVRILVEHGANPNIRHDCDELGTPPLMYLVEQQKSLDLLELLLENDADPNLDSYHDCGMEEILYDLIRRTESCEYGVKAACLVLRYGFRPRCCGDYHTKSLLKLSLLKFTQTFPLAERLLEREEPFEPEHCCWSRFKVLRKAVKKSIVGRSEAEARLLLDKANALLDRAILKPPPLRFTLRAGAVDTLPASLKSLCRALIRRSLLPCPLEPKIQTLPLPNSFRDQLRTLDQDWTRTGPGLDQDWTSTEPVLTSPRFPH